MREGVPLLRPEKVGDADTARALAEQQPDLGVVVAFGQFMPRHIRELPALGYCINAHASLLPRWRGAAPIAHAILAGDRETGVSVMRVEREMDAGPVALSSSLPIGEDENTAELSERIAVLAADLLEKAVEAIARDEIEWTPQDDAQASFAPRLTRADAALDWREPATALARRVRAMAPTPGAFTRVDGEVLRILEARAEPGAVDRPPGTVREERGLPLRIATGEGWLVPRTLQRAGGRALGAEAYLRGRPIPDGTRLGDASLDSHG